VSGNALLRAQVAMLEAGRLGRTPRSQPSQLVDAAFCRRVHQASGTVPCRTSCSGPQAGKQPGAPGKHLAQVSEPDKVVNHAPPSCTSCGSDLDDAEVVDTEHIISDLERLQTEMAGWWRRAEVAEAVAIERERTIEVQSVAMRMLDVGQPTLESSQQSHR
jgi:hypothetical protein